MAAKSRGELFDTLRIRNVGSEVLASTLFDLGRLAKRGDSEVLKAAIAYLQNTAAEVKSEAAYAVGRTAEKGDIKATNALILALDDHHNFLVRQHAVEALRMISKRGDVNVVTVLVKVLEHDSCSGVRRDAAHALSVIAKRGDKMTTKALLGRLEDGVEDCEEVCNFASFALGCVAREGDEKALTAILHRLLSGPAARHMAAEALYKYFSDDESGPIIAMFVAKIEKMERRRVEIQRYLDAGADGGPSIPQQPTSQFQSTQSSFATLLALEPNDRAPAPPERKTSRSRSARRTRKD